MSNIQIDFLTLDTVIGSISDFIDTCMSRSREKGVKCQRTSNGAMIEGDKEILLEILDELDNTLIDIPGKKRVLIMLNFDDSYDNSQRQSRNKAAGVKYDLLVNKVE